MNKNSQTHVMMNEKEKKYMEKMYIIRVAQLLSLRIFKKVIRHSICSPVYTSRNFSSDFTVCEAF